MQSVERYNLMFKTLQEKDAQSNGSFSDKDFISRLLQTINPLPGIPEFFHNEGFNTTLWNVRKKLQQTFSSTPTKFSTFS